jgi:hypothetical protein
MNVTGKKIKMKTYELKSMLVSINFYELRVCGNLVHGSPKMVLGTSLHGKNPSKFLFLKVIPFSEGMIA